MTLKLWFPVLMVSVLCACVHTPADSAFTPPSGFQPAMVAYPKTNPKGFPDPWWMNRFNDECEAAQKNSDCKIVFLGDSITDGWSGHGKKVWEREWSAYHPLNFGISGDRVENLLWRLENGILAKELNPQLFILMIGTNNTGYRMEAPEAIAGGVQKIVKLLRAGRPEAKILLLGIFPRGANAQDKNRRNNDAANAVLKTLADDRHVFYQDIAEVYLKPDGTLERSIMPDLLHPNEKGYEGWARAMKPTVEKLLERS